MSFGKEKGFLRNESDLKNIEEENDKSDFLDNRETIKKEEFETPSIKIVKIEV